MGSPAPPIPTEPTEPTEPSEPTEPTTPSFATERVEGSAFFNAYATCVTLERILVTPPEVDRLLFFPFSAVMPETTAWESNQLPRFPKRANQWRILLVLGNVAHFAGIMPQQFWPVILKLPDWEHVIYVPGPYDYGAGTLELGDAYLRKLHALDNRLTVFAHNCPTTSIYLTGPRVLVRGAACFPVETVHYEDARVYQRKHAYIPAMGHIEDSGLDDAADKEAIVEGRWVTTQRAQERLTKDVETLLKVTNANAVAHVIVTYGCPDELAAATRKKSPFHAVAKLGSAKVYAQFAALGAAYWFCGAPTDKPTCTMYGSTTKLCSNCYMPGPRKLPSMKSYLLEPTPTTTQKK